MIGLAMMVAKLATEHARKSKEPSFCYTRFANPDEWYCATDRETCRRNPEGFCASRMYYALIDRITFVQKYYGPMGIYCGSFDVECDGIRIGLHRALRVNHIVENRL